MLQLRIHIFESSIKAVQEKQNWIPLSNIPPDNNSDLPNTFHADTISNDDFSIFLYTWHALSAKEFSWRARPPIKTMPTDRKWLKLFRRKGTQRLHRRTGWGSEQSEIRPLGRKHIPSNEPRESQSPFFGETVTYLHTKHTQTKKKKEITDSFTMFFTMHVRKAASPLATRTLRGILSSKVAYLSFFVDLIWRNSDSTYKSSPTISHNKNSTLFSISTNHS